MQRLDVRFLPLLALAACSGATSPPPTDTPRFIGVYSAARATGTLSITLPPDAVPPSASGYGVGTTTTPLPVSGSLLVRGEGPLPLSGSIYPSPGTVYLRTDVYALYGYAEAGDAWASGQGFVSIEGQMFSPLGAALFTALFGTQADVRIWCGAFRGSSSGNWSLVQATGGPLKAMVVSSDATITARLEGSLTGATLSLDEEASTRPAKLGASGSAVGTGDSLTGTWAQTDGKTGTWWASVRACR